MDLYSTNLFKKGFPMPFKGLMTKILWELFRNVSESEIGVLLEMIQLRLNIKEIQMLY
jgi:hypothetical protein